MSKCAIVTGGAGGIGLGIAKALAKEGCNIVIADIRADEDVHKVISGLESLGGKAHYIKSNVACPKDREKLIKEAVERFGRIDILVNNAGVAPKVRMDLLETTEESFDFVMDINLKGTFFLSQLAARQMISQENIELPRIINISSVSADTSSINRGEYCISKAAASMVTMLFADRLAEEGIRVFEIRPGVIKTDMTAVVTEKYDKMIAEGLTPIKRWGYPEDIGGIVASLCRKEFDFCTGNVINVDGGFHIRRL
ncbi:MAG: 3-ketoacyl-ACP reductase [Defluviitaleaceae bacterium]|nr:3-ketoacyl-ACP reductase [Defluviitaleaceae bacterium]